MNINEYENLILDIKKLRRDINLNGILINEYKLTCEKNCDPLLNKINISIDQKNINLNKTIFTYITFYKNEFGIDKYASLYANLSHIIVRLKDIDKRYRKKYTDMSCIDDDLSFSSDDVITPSNTDPLISDQLNNSNSSFLKFPNGNLLLTQNRYPIYKLKYSSYQQIKNLICKTEEMLQDKIIYIDNLKTNKCGENKIITVETFILAHLFGGICIYNGSSFKYSLHDLEKLNFGFYFDKKIVNNKIYNVNDYISPPDYTLKENQPINKFSGNIVGKPSSQKKVSNPNSSNTHDRFDNDNHYIKPYTNNKFASAFGRNPQYKPINSNDSDDAYSTDDSNDVYSTDDSNDNKIKHTDPEKQRHIEELTEKKFRDRQEPILFISFNTNIMPIRAIEPKEIFIERINRQFSTKDPYLNSKYDHMSKFIRDKSDMPVNCLYKNILNENNLNEKDFEIFKSNIIKYIHSNSVIQNSSLYNSQNNVSKYKFLNYDILFVLYYVTFKLAENIQNSCDKSGDLIISCKSNKCKHDIDKFDTDLFNYIKEIIRENEIDNKYKILVNIPIHQMMTMYKNRDNTANGYLQMSIQELMQ